MNFRYNISKKCESCGVSFITDLFNEQDCCGNCSDISIDVFNAEEDQFEIDMLLHPSGCRTKVYYYD